MPLNIVKNSAFALVLGLSLTATACSNATDAQVKDDASAKAQEMVDTAKKKGAKAVYEPFGIPSGNYVMDKTHGYVTFSYSHLGLSNPQLRFRDIDASVQLDAENLENSQVTALIKSASIDSGVDVFDEHLNSDDWLDTATHPEISFASTGFTRETQTSGKMRGDLTIMGITKQVEFDVVLLAAMEHPRAKKPVMGLEGTADVLRSDWDLGKYSPGVSDEVQINISSEFIMAE